MGAKQHIEISFEFPFQGIARNEKGFSVNIGIEDDDARPYDLLLSALGACLYANFVAITNEKKLSFEKVEIDLSGERRDKVPMTLKNCRIVFKVMGAENQKGFQESLDLASKNCSIYQTISNVAEMETELKFG